MAMNIFSYNCEGIKKSDCISSLMNRTYVDIICLQETWLLDSNMCLICDIHSDYLYTGISGVDSKTQKHFEKSTF